MIDLLVPISRIFGIKTIKEYNTCCIYFLPVLVVPAPAKGEKRKQTTRVLCAGSLCHHIDKFDRWKWLHKHYACFCLCLWKWCGIWSSGDSTEWCFVNVAWNLLEIFSRIISKMRKNFSHFPRPAKPTLKWRGLFRNFWLARPGGARPLSMCHTSHVPLTCLGHKITIEVNI